MNVRKYLQSILCRCPDYGASESEVDRLNDISEKILEIDWTDTHIEGRIMEKIASVRGIEIIKKTDHQSRHYETNWDGYITGVKESSKISYKINGVEVDSESLSRYPGIVGMLNNHLDCLTREKEVEEAENKLKSLQEKLSELKLSHLALDNFTITDNHKGVDDHENL